MSKEDETWTEEKCLQLLREYKAKPLLWDTKHAFYYKKQNKLQAWKELGQALGVSAAVCRHKIAVLLSSLRREKSKILRSRKEIANGLSNGPEYKSRWFAFEEMSFIFDREAERRKRAMGHVEDEEDTKMRTNDKEEDSDDGGESVDPFSWFDGSGTQSDNEHLLEVSSSKRMRTITADTSRVNQRPLAHTMDTEIEIESFTNFIAMKMKKYSERTKNSVQQAICEIIFKADQSSYNDGAISSDYAANTDRINDTIPIETDSYVVKQERLGEDANY